MPSSASAKKIERQPRLEASAPTTIGAAPGPNGDHQVHHREAARRFLRQRRMRTDGAADHQPAQPPSAWRSRATNQAVTSVRTALPQEAARRLAMMNLMVAIGPGAAPIVGGALASSLGWRSIFFALALLGIVNLLFSWRLLPESKAPASKRPDSRASPATTAACSFRPPSWALRWVAAAPRHRCTPSSAPRPSSSPTN